MWQVLICWCYITLVMMPNCYIIHANITQWKQANLADILLRLQKCEKLNVAS